MPLLCTIAHKLLLFSQQQVQFALNFYCTAILRRNLKESQAKGKVD